LQNKNVERNARIVIAKVENGRFEVFGFRMAGWWALVDL
jgi:hypothetical protein